MKLLTPDAAAAMLGVSKTTLLKWRMKNIGPPFYRAGRNIRYNEDDLVAWLESRKEVPQNDQSDVPPVPDSA
jgi:excisionase family DNA binding protein